MEYSSTFRVSFEGKNFETSKIAITGRARASAKLHAVRLSGETAGNCAYTLHIDAVHRAALGFTDASKHAV